MDDSRRYDSIDALRAIAVSFVLTSHLTRRFSPEYMLYDTPVSVPWDGKYGVFLFFIVSGYCIAMTAEGAGNVGVFWLRRFTRLQPAFMACIALTLVVVSTLGLPGREATIMDGVKDALWLPLVTPTTLVDGAYWSLLEEAKFYLVFGVFYYAAPTRIVALFAAFTAIGAVIHLMGWFADHHALIWSFKGAAHPYFMFPYSLFFLIGIAARRCSYLVQAAVLCGCLAVLYAIGQADFSLVAALAALGMIGVQMRNVRIWRPITFIGLISYPLYLLHQNIGVAIIRSLAPWIPDPLTRIILVTSTLIALAWLVSWSVEHRFRRRIENAVRAAFSTVVLGFRRANIARS